MKTLERKIINFLIHIHGIQFQALKAISQITRKMTLKFIN